MLGSHFYNEVTRKSIIAFGTLFNNISVKKKDPSTGAVLEESKVPLAYGPRQKFLVRLEQMVSATRKVSITVPRLYFEMNSVDYDPQRIRKVGILINLTNEIPKYFSTFERLVEIVDAREEVRKPARQRFIFYKNRGYSVDSHSLNQ